MYQQRMVSPIRRFPSSLSYFSSILSIPSSISSSSNAPEVNTFQSFYSYNTKQEQQQYSSNTKRYYQTAKQKFIRPPKQIQPTKNIHPQQQQYNNKTTWVSFQDTVPKFSSLTDLLTTVERTINHIKLQKDLFATTTNDNNISTSLHSYPNHLVLDARIQLSNLKRFHGWYLRFPSYFIAQSFVDYHNNNQNSELLEQQQYGSIGSNIVVQRPSCFILSPQEVKKRVPESTSINLNDSVLRLEHAPKPTTIADIYHLLRHWEFSNVVDKPIVPLQEICRHPVGVNHFIIYMEDAANARSVVRELQCCDLNGHTSLFFRYPDQLISDLELLESPMDFNSE